MADTQPLLDENFNEIIREPNLRLKRELVKSILPRDGLSDDLNHADEFKPIWLEPTPQSEIGNDLPNAIASPAIEFYKDRSIFITGATGFMGKVLVFKLLKHCPHLKRLYLLIRPKRGSQPADRLKDLFKTPIFDGLPETALAKVIVVQGDIAMPNLGLSHEDEEILVDSVSVIFHSAATVRFDEDLTKSVEMNICGTKSIVELARKLRHLSAMVHLSTAYSHCYKEVIEEKFYATQSLDYILELCRLAKENQSLQDVLNQPQSTKALIGEHPNTYTFTKALAEQVLFNEAADLPVAIVRPSIVIAAWKEPMPGWIDNINGPTGIIAGASSGVLRSVYVDDEKVADFIPVDVAINLMCVVASRIGHGRRPEVDLPNPTELGHRIPIYHITSGAVNPLTWYNLRVYTEPVIDQVPMMHMIWYPGIMYQSNKWVHWFCFLLLQKIPAAFLDIILAVLGYRTFLNRLVERMERTMGALDFFVHRQWDWKMNNLAELDKSLSPEEKEIFPLNLQEMDWPIYLQSYVYGTRTYVMKENPENIRFAKWKMNFLWMFQFLFVASVIFGCTALISLIDPTEITDDFAFNGFIGFSCAFILLYRGTPDFCKNQKYKITDETIQRLKKK